MSEENLQDQPNQGDPENTTQDESQALTTDAVREMIAEAVNAASETSKKEIAGLNRKNSELEKQLSDERKAKMTEAERATAELEELRTAAERERKEVHKLQRERWIDQALTDAGLSLDFANRITGENQEEVQADVKKFAEIFGSKVKETSDKEVNGRLGNTPPQRTGQSPENTMKRSDYDQLPLPKQDDFLKGGGSLID